MDTRKRFYETLRAITRRGLPGIITSISTKSWRFDSLPLHPLKFHGHPFTKKPVHVACTFAWVRATRDKGVD